MKSKIIALGIALVLLASGMGIVSTASSDVYIPYDDSYEVRLQAPNTEKVYLVVIARIDWHRLAGAADIMQIKVNGNTITGTQLINKGPTWTYADGRTFPYYNIHNTSSWAIFYSPDFTSNNIAQSGYRVIEGNAYTYKFNVTGMVNRGQMNTVTIRHSGPEYISSIPDITTKTINEIKSTKIVVKSVYFVGEGKEYPIRRLTLRKSVTPYSIKQRQKANVIITVENAGTTTLYDIEVVDAPPAEFEFVSGDTSAKYTALKPGESRTFSYVIKSVSAGKFDLGKAKATYADEEGNYHTVESNAPMIEVLAPLIKPEIPREEKKIPGFEIVSALATIFAVARMRGRRRK